MNTLAIILSVCLFAVAFAAPYGGSYYPRHGTNADRQLYVNHVAESIGSGTGTADEYKVPGAYGSAYGYGYGYRNGYHGNGYGYGNNFYGNRYGYDNGHYGTDYYGGDYYPKH